MKKLSDSLILTLASSMVVLYIIITMFVGAHYNWLSSSTFWTRWTLTLIPVLIAITITGIIYFKNRKNELFVMMPIIISTAIFEVVSLIIGIILTFVLTALKAQTTWYMWMFQCIIVVVYVVRMIFLVNGTLTIQHNRKVVKQKVYYIRQLVSKLEAVIPTISDQAYKTAVENLRDNVKYSDPMSNDAVFDIEREICNTVDGIVDRINVGSDYETNKAEIQKANMLIRQRNEEIKNSK